MTHFSQIIWLPNLGQGLSMKIMFLLTKELLNYNKIELPNNDALNLHKIHKSTLFTII